MLLSGIAGLSAFEIVDQSPDEISVNTPIDNNFRFAQSEFHYAGPGADLVANGKYEAHRRFVVTKNSTSRISETNSCPENVRVLRQKLREDGVLKEYSGRLLFVSDHSFSSPSLAANVVYGGSVNGRSAWVDSDGRSINDLDKISLNKQEAIEAMPKAAVEALPKDNG